MKLKVKLKVIHNTDPQNPDRGVHYTHFRRCLEEMPAGETPRTWARLSVAWTDDGVQVYCARHNLNVDDAVFRLEAVH